MGEGVRLATNRSVGVAPEVILQNSSYGDDKAGKRGDLPWLCNPGQTSAQVQDRNTSSPAKNVYKKKQDLSFCSDCM